MATETAPEEGVAVLAQDLSKRFGRDWALVRASFRVRRGALALLTGANGSGKTTLIRCLSTALVPDFGRATISGLDLVSGRDLVRGRVAALTQPPGYYGALTARENLTLTRDVLRLGQGGSLDALLGRVGLASKEKVPLEAFSSGMKQRFALARLSLLERDVLLLDEPESHLDSAGLDLLLELISEWKNRGAALLCATHATDRFQDLKDLEIRLTGGESENAGAGR